MMYLQTTEPGVEQNSGSSRRMERNNGELHNQSSRKRSAIEIVRNVKAARGRTPEELALAARALELSSRFSNETRVSEVRTALAYGLYESELKLDIAVDRMLDDVIL